MLFSTLATAMTTTSTEAQRLSLLAALHSAILDEGFLMVKEKVDAIREDAAQEGGPTSRRLDRLSNALWASIEAPGVEKNDVARSTFFYILHLLQKDCSLERLSDLPCKTVFANTLLVEAADTTPGRSLKMEYRLNPMEALILNHRGSWIRELSENGWDVSHCTFEDLPMVLPEATEAGLHIYAAETLQQLRYYAIRSWIARLLKSDPDWRIKCLAAEEGLRLLRHPIEIQINSDGPFVGQRIVNLRRARPFWS